MKNETFSLAAENAPIPGCTVSGEVMRNAFVFSLSAGTDISREQYPAHKLWIALQGEMTILADSRLPFRAGDIYITPTDIPVGIKAETDSVYVEILPGETAPRKENDAGLH